ncbi:MAG: radical SAM family heme chaperone HemW [Acidobacteriota bacterium]
MRKADSPLGVYVHVPFCRARCSYCAFYTVAHHATAIQPFIRSLRREIRHLARRGYDEPELFVRPAQGRCVDSVFLGGGTPSLLPGEALASLLGTVREFFRVTSDAEVTLEANPETVTAAAAAGWRHAGVTRVSVGAQTFSDARLARLGRRHTAASIRQAVRDLRAAGCDNISLDLIAGVSPARLDEDVDAACAISPDHLSMYLLEVTEEETGAVTPLARQVAAGACQVPEADWYADAYPRAVSRLARAGLDRYEICNFARPGRVCRHNLKYWLDRDVLGFGPGAHSSCDGTRFANVADLQRWQQPLLTRGRPETPRADRRTTGEANAERAMLALRLEEGAPRAWLEQLLPGRAGRGDTAPLDDLLEAGFMISDGERVALSTRGMLVSNEIFQRFLP